MSGLDDKLVFGILFLSNFEDQFSEDVLVVFRFGLSQFLEEINPFEQVFPVVDEHFIFQLRC